jgi:ABC-type transport system involved in Fe-S cluster assembly, ATPase component
MLKMIDVGVAFDGDGGNKQVLNSINLTLENNKIYVMTGPNGGGKSSIAKVIMGIYPVDDGKIMLDDTDITDMDITERAKLGVGYAFQMPARFKGLRVRDLLKLASGGQKIDECQLLYDVGLCAQDYLDREINATFSGGELKRIEIASILARNLKIAVFDEPEAGIDLWSFQRLTETFENLHRKYDTTIVIISHQERILKLADEVILIADGTVSGITSHEEFLDEISQMDNDCLCRENCVKGGNKNAECSR